MAWDRYCECCDEHRSRLIDQKTSKTPLTDCYGSKDGDLHPKRNEVVNSAHDRFSAGNPTDADLFVLWADIQINDLSVRVENLELQ